MKLWSIWDEPQYEYFTQHGYLAGDWSRVDADYIEQYRWLSEFVPDRPWPGRTLAKADTPPVWAWCAHGGADRPAPNLNDAGHLPEGESGYCVELWIEPAYVLLSQFQLWAMILNNAYVTADGAERDRLDEAERSLTAEEIRRATRETWPRIFDLAFGDEDDWGPVEEREIQACVRFIAESDIVGMEKFVGR